MGGARGLLGPLAVVTTLALAAPGGPAAATPPPTPPATSTTVAGDPAATTTTVAGAPAPSTTVVAPTETLPRAGSAIGGLDRRSDDETWSVRRVATATALGIAALAIVGHVYGRLLSISPRVGRSIARSRP